MGVACVWCASVGGQEPGKRCSASLADCDVSMLYTACACTPRRASAFLWLRPSGSGDGNVTGFSTPAAVFGHRLVDRLHGVGIRQVNVSNAMCSLLLCPKPERRAASSTVPAACSALLGVARHRAASWVCCVHPLFCTSCASTQMHMHGTHATACKTISSQCN